MAPTTLAVECTHAELKDGQMKEVAFGKDGKVLLSKVQGQIYATSSQVRPPARLSSSRRCRSMLTALSVSQLVRSDERTRSARTTARPSLRASFLAEDALSAPG